MLEMRFPNGVKKAFTLSYDDGLYDDIRLMQMMHDHGVKGTFNISSDIYRREDEPVCGGWPRFTLNESIELFNKYDNEVAVHGLMHRDFTKLNEAELYYEISADRAQLEKRYSRIVKGAAYPYGSWNYTAIEALKKCGIKYCRTCGFTPDFKIPDNWHAWGATCHHNYEGLNDLAERFVNEDFPDCRIFYVWGHTAEFRRDNNWCVMENLLDTVSGKNDIWYATNLEIVEYIEAYRSLEYSVAPDTNIVHNPNGIDIWLSFKGEVVMIPAGKTVKL